MKKRVFFFSKIVRIIFIGLCIFSFNSAWAQNTSLVQPQARTESWKNTLEYILKQVGARFNESTKMSPEEYSVFQTFYVEQLTDEWKNIGRVVQNDSITNLNAEGFINYEEAKYLKWFTHFKQLNIPIPAPSAARKSSPPKPFGYDTIRPDPGITQPPCSNVDFETGNLNGWKACGALDAAYWVPGLLYPGSPAWPFAFYNATQYARPPFPPGYSRFADCYGPAGNLTATAPGPYSSGFPLKGDPQVIITSGNGFDCASAGLVPVVCPAAMGGGQHSVQLGDSSNDAFCGMGILEQKFLVTKANADFTYMYAVLLENPQHPYYDQPYFRVIFNDQNGDTIAGCGQYLVVADKNAPGFVAKTSWTRYCFQDVDTVMIKPWSCVFVSLRKYIGQAVTVQFIVSDCSESAHFGRAYVDAKCDSLVIKKTSTGNCKNKSATLTAPTSCGISGYQWSGPCISGPSNGQSVDVTCDGIYKVILISATGGCSDTLTDTVKLASIGGLNTDFTFAGSCGKMTFTDTSNIAGGTWSWTFPGGNPATSTSQNPGTITYAPGTYTANVIVTNASGCTDTVKHPFTVNNGFPDDFTFKGSCGSMTFTDTTTAANINWNWQFPGGNPGTSTSQNPGTVTYPAGTYTTTLIVTTASGCTDTIQHNFTVSNPPLVANFTSSPVCIGVPTNFTDQSSGPPTTWNWNFGDGNNSAIQNPSNTYSAAGTYTVTLIAAAGACGTDTVSIPVTVNPLPLASFTNTTVCLNNPTLFTDASTGNNTISTWSWNFGDGSNSNLQNPSHTYNTAGTYTSSLVVTNNFGCKDSFPLTTVVNPLPLSSFSTTPVCLGTSTCFSDLSTIIAPNTITNWSWNFGDQNSANNISNVQNPCHTFSSAGTFSVMLTSTSNNNCQSTTILTVTVNPLPTAQFTNTSPCLGATTSLTDGSTSIATDPINNWNWNMTGGNPASSNSQNPSTAYNTAGTHTINLIVTTKSGCTDTVDQMVNVYNPPTANFNGAGTGCAPLCNQYNDLSTSVDGTITNWVWSFPGGSPASSNMQNPTNICYKNPGTYGASLIVTTSLGCIDTIHITPLVTVYAWPSADFCVAPVQAPATDPVFNFCDQWSQDVVVWNWNFGDNELDSVNTNPSHSYSATATANDFYNYNVCLKVQNQHGCWDTICKTVELIPEFEFYIPNTFTPNGDNLNEFFFGKCRGVKEYNIWVFDRWGNLLWDCHKEDKNTNWDNTGQDGLSSFCKWDGVVVSGGQDMSGHSNQLAQQDVYVWKVALTDIFNKQHSYIGNVNIVK